MSKDAKKIEALTGELHTLVQGLQGDAYCSDGVYASTIKEFFEFTEAQLYWNREASKAMAKFLRKYKKLRDAANASSE